MKPSGKSDVSPLLEKTESPKTQKSRQSCEKKEQGIGGQMLAFCDCSPNMRRSNQAKDRTGGNEIRFHQSVLPPTLRLTCRHLTTAGWSADTISKFSGIAERKA
jgi:hypothetical protein